MLIHGGRDFDLRVANTESMKSPQAVTNIVQSLIKVVSLALYAGANPHNKVIEAYLATSKSLKLPIIDPKTQTQNQDIDDSKWEKDD